MPNVALGYNIWHNNIIIEHSLIFRENEYNDTQGICNKQYNNFVFFVAVYLVGNQSLSWENNDDNYYKCNYYAKCKRLTLLKTWQLTMIYIIVDKRKQKYFNNITNIFECENLEIYKIILYLPERVFYLKLNAFTIFKNSYKL